MTEQRPRRRVLLMVWDGLRPDLVSEQVTPNLHGLAARGVRFAGSHAVYPTVTRVNAAAIATGMLPVRHGIANNLFCLPEQLPGRVINTGLATDLELLRPVRSGRVLPARTLGEYIHEAGGRSVIVSSGSPGSTLLQHPEAMACDDVIFHPAFQVGLSLAEVEQRYGALPPKTMPNTAQNRYITRLIADYLLAEVAPVYLAFWHCDPDHTQHQHGIGHPETVRSLRDADENLGTILTALDRLGLAGETDVLITSDHGFSTVVDGADLTALLIEAGLKAERDSDDVQVLGDMIYVKDGCADATAAIVAVLRREGAVGPIFTGADGAEPAPGTIALCEAGLGGAGSPEIQLSPAWDDAHNRHGAPGLSRALAPRTAKAATHGSISPWDIRNTLIAAGPDFARGMVSLTPAGNLDIMPTALHLLGLPVPEGLDGRVLFEALDGQAAAEPATVRTESITADSDDARQILQISRVGHARYLDWGVTER